MNVVAPRDRHIKTAIALLGVVLCATVLIVADKPFAYAQSIQEQIQTQSEKIQQIEEEIAQYKEQLNDIDSRKQTLENAVETLDVSRRKLSADIQLTQERVNTVQLEISELSEDISGNEEIAETHQRTLGEAIRTIDEIESQSIVEALLQENTLTDFWQRLESLRRFHVRLQNELEELRTVNDKLETQRGEARTKRGELVALRDELAGQKAALDATRAEKAQLLEQTQQKESNYQQLLAEKQRQKERFQQQLFQLESKLDTDVDADRVPSPGSGILSWPVPDPSAESCWNGGADAENCITQFFGKTSDSGRLYRSGTHNGVDFRASPGTRVSATLSGTVKGAGNTDRFPGCYSYGKWILVEHNNGISTMYAHLSHTRVDAGDEVAAGETIGYSGNTGYSTGPHLHLTAYASQGVEIVRLGDYRDDTNCPDAHIPVAPRDAYLDPLAYF